MAGGGGGTSLVTCPTPDPQPRGAVLRKPAFGDVEVRDNLDARNDGLRQHGGRRRDRPQQAVNAHADHQSGLKGLDVNVAGAQLYGLFQQIVDGANHGCAAGKVAQAFDVVLTRLVQFVATGQIDIVVAQAPIKRNREVFDRGDLDRDIPRLSTISAARRAAVSVGSATANTAPPSAA